MVSVSLKDEEWNTILTKAVLDSLSDEAKNAILGDAVKHLNTPTTSAWSDPNKGKTVLQIAFQHAVDLLIDRIVLDLLQETMYDRVKEQVRVLLDQFPPIQNDPGLQVKVAEAIMNYMREQEHRH